MTEDQKNEQTAKRDILKCARTLFAKKGFEGVSVREIAKESGQNISMISYYFGGKEGLYKEILSDHMKLVSGAVNKLFKGHANKEMTAKTFRAELKSLVSIFVNMKFNNPEMMSLMQRERVNGLPFARDLHEQIIGPLALQVVDVFKEAQKKKIIRSGFEPGVFLGVLFESIVGYVTIYDCGMRALKGSLDLPKDKEKFIDFLTDLFLEGIKK
ncbi:MAG: TetR/AcrR family transcriptional regulator [Bdellovibrionaceae bacterium]|nr:TetR/AcrR family transcriptional regulator [Pseudobdellovibrionaceae bacterium]